MTERYYQKILNNSRGQTLLEFLLLFVMIIGLSFAVLNITSSSLGGRWAAIANKILAPSPNPQNHNIQPVTLR